MDKLDRDILEYVDEAIFKYGRSPSLKEIGETLGVSTQTVQNRLNKMGVNKAKYNKAASKEIKYEVLRERLTRYIEGFKAINGREPTARQMMSFLEINSASTLYKVLEMTGYKTGGAQGGNGGRCPYGDKVSAVMTCIRHCKEKEIALVDIVNALKSKYTKEDIIKAIIYLEENKAIDTKISIR